MHVRIKYLLNHPFEVSLDDVPLLQDEIDKYPYFSTLRTLLLFGLKEHSHATYDEELKKTSIYSPSRTALYYYLQKEKQEAENIETEEESEVVKEVAPAPIAAISEPEIEAPEIDTVSSETEIIVESAFETEISEEVETEIEEIPSEEVEETEEVQTDEDTVEIDSEEIEDEPVVKTVEETPVSDSKMTFSQWLSRAETPTEEIPTEEKEESKPELEVETETSSEKDIKFKIIDEFIDKAPKISQLSKTQESPKAGTSQSEKQQPYSDLMTETLAQIYIDQKKYDKAIRAYRILILKYPDKKTAFNERITEIEKIRDTK